MRFFRTQRIRKQSVFENFKTKGTSAGSTSFSLRYMKADENIERPMLGIIASRKVGNAIIRNWCKRRVREIFRMHQEKLDAHGEYLIILRKAMFGRAFTDIEGDFLYCMRKIQSCKSAKKVDLASNCKNF